MSQSQPSTSAGTPNADLWADTISANICAMYLRRAEHDGAVCPVTFRSARIGNVTVSRYQTKMLTSGSRSMEHIRKDQLDGFLINLPLSAEFGFSQRGNECRVLPGSFALLATARPFQLREQQNLWRDTVASLHVVVPGPLLRERCPQVDDLCSRSLPILPGAGQLMRSVISAAVRDGAALSSGEAQHLSNFLVDLIAGALLQEDEKLLAINSPRQRANANTLGIATSFIAANLSNPELDTALVAENCNVSVRYLQMLFESASMSVAASILELRLLRCQDFLKNKQLQNRTIAEIATLWGFNNFSNFSRAYKARFGIPPQHERKLVKRAGNS